MEGGAIEVDGSGTAILTESCILNDNRNPGLTKAQAETILKPLLGLQKIILASWRQKSRYYRCPHRFLRAVCRARPGCGALLARHQLV